jgi:hypothetical protein
MPDKFKPIQPLPEDSIKIKSAEEKMYDQAKKTPTSAMRRAGKKEGGEMKKKSFPDLTGDGKVSMKDILKGRGVIKKKGGMMKRADGGSVERFTSSDIKKAKDAVNQGGSSETFTSSDVKKAKKAVKGMQDGGLIRMHKQMAMSTKKFT